MESPLPIRHYVNVRQRPTVVRLDELERKSDWITSSFYITRDIADHLSGLSHALRQPSGCGMFVIGQYGSGKSHWLAYVTCQLRAGQFVNDPPEVLALSLLNYRATTPLEDIVCGALGIEAQHEDRRGPWAQLQSQHPRGLLLIIDELSEFLRSKPDHRAFNEDVRFLQFLGEWAQGQRFWVVAAMQEGIEHTGELEHGLYRKIKDRFPLRFLLSPTHVKDLIRESILVKSDDYAQAVDALAVVLKQALPQSAIHYDDLRSLYPLHPATLELLEEVRDRFSQARGIVDFAIMQLAGNPARNIEPFLDRPWGSLLTPDVIVDHFRDLFEIQPEFLGLAQQFFPYYQKHLPEIFPSSAMREQAERMLKLLVLVHLSPTRDGLDVREAANWLLFRATRVDPQKNIDILGRILRQLADAGRYVVEHEGRYRIELRDDGVAALETFLQRQKEELQRQEEIVLEELCQQLGEEDFNPLRLPRDQWQQRSVTWHFHQRPYSVYVGNERPPPLEGVGLCIRLPWGHSEPAPPGMCVVQPAPLALGEELLELAALLRARARTWSRDVTNRLEGRLKERLALLRSQLRAAYRDAEITGPQGERETPPQVEASPTLRQWLDGYGQWLMRRRYPGFERFAPGHGPLPKEAYRSLMRFALQGELGEYDAEDYVKLIREAYLVPMRLLTRQGRSYAIPSNLDRHELITLIRPLLDLQPSPALIYENAGQSIYGLVPDQTGIMLVYLHILGEIDIRKGRRSYRELFETLPDPLQYDQVVRCSALSIERLHELQILCEGLNLRVPKEWTVLAQRKMAHQLKDVLARQTEPLRQLLMNVQQEEGAAELVKTLRQFLSWNQTLRQGNDELNDLQQFLFEVGSARRFLSVLSELQTLPERLERILSERKRYEHLFHHPAVNACLDPAVAIRIEALQAPPSLDQPEEVQRWLADSQSAYEHYKESYRARHEAWWQQISADPVWHWRPPRIALSRHVGLEEVLERLRACRERADRLRCRGLVNLDFQPLCSCGFDGRTSPIAEELERMRALVDQVEQSLGLFFQQESVRARMHAWIEQGLESNTRTLAYLQNEEPYPEVQNIELLDRHLAGVQLVKEVDAAPIVELLCERTWDKGALEQALRDVVNKLPSMPLRFRREKPADQAEVTEWCVEQALRSGSALPKPLRSAAADMADRIRVEWVSSAALARLEELGLGDKIIERIIQWLLEDQVKVAEHATTNRQERYSDLVAAALEVRRPTQPADARQMAALAERLYRAHASMSSIGGQPWLDRLDSLARTPLGNADNLMDVLRPYAGEAHLLIDCLGLPLLGQFEAHCIDFFPGWHVIEVQFGRVSGESTTDACYRMLIESGFDQKLEKINRVDALVHAQFLPFEDFARLAMAELAIACRAVRARLDPGAPLVVFADHGFRIAPDGRSYRHGGDSTLERMVPVIYLQPR